MIYIFDIDGTLCDLSHRLHLIQKGKNDWNGFHDACDKDSPIEETIEVARSLSLSGHTLLLVSGRPKSVYGKTESWFEQRELWHLFDGLYMRETGDYRQDSIVKAELLEEVLKKYKKEDIAGIFDDRQQVVDMWRSKGFRVFQVAEGNF